MAARRFPRWAGLIEWPVGLPLFHGLLPWGLSSLAARAGWNAGVPGAWNWAGLPLVALGFMVIAWSLLLHYEGAPQGWRYSLAPDYLLRRGPYRFSRNPMYVSGLLVWLGWSVFFGSWPVLVGAAVLTLLFALLAVPAEERALEARFGQTYRDYRRRTPRWLGRRRL